MGRNPTVSAIEDGVARVCRGNGSLLHISIAAFPEKLLKHIAANMWQAALQVSFDLSCYVSIIFMSLIPTPSAQ